MPLNIALNAVSAARRRNARKKTKEATEKKMRDKSYAKAKKATEKKMRDKSLDKKKPLRKARAIGRKA